LPRPKVDAICLVDWPASMQLVTFLRVLGEVGFMVASGRLDRKSGSCMIVGHSLIELKIAVHAYEPLSSGHVSDFS